MRLGWGGLKLLRRMFTVNSLLLIVLDVFSK